MACRTPGQSMTRGATLTDGGAPGMALVTSAATFARLSCCKPEPNRIARRGLPPRHQIVLDVAAGALLPRSICAKSPPVMQPASTARYSIRRSASTTTAGARPELSAYRVEQPAELMKSITTNYCSFSSLLSVTLAQACGDDAEGMRAPADSHHHHHGDAGVEVQPPRLRTDAGFVEEDAGAEDSVLPPNFPAPISTRRQSVDGREGGARSSPLLRQAPFGERHAELCLLSRAIDVESLFDGRARAGSTGERLLSSMSLANVAYLSVLTGQFAVDGYAGAADLGADVRQGARGAGPVDHHVVAAGDAPYYQTSFERPIRPAESSRSRTRCTPSRASNARCFQDALRTIAGARARARARARSGGEGADFRRGEARLRAVQWASDGVFPRPRIVQLQRFD